MSANIRKNGELCVSLPVILICFVKLPLDLGFS